MAVTVEEAKARLASMSPDFALCAQFAATKGAFSKEPSQAEKLRLYGLYKYVTAGPCKSSGVPRPGMLSFGGRAKYDAWHAVGSDLSRADAEAAYVSLVSSLCPDWRSRAEVIARGKGERAARREKKRAEEENGMARADDAEDEDEYDYSSDEVDGGIEGGGMMGGRMSRFAMEGTGDPEDGPGGEEGGAGPKVVGLAAAGDIEGLKAMIDGAPADKRAELAAATNDMGLTALLAAVDRSHKGCVEYLLGTGLFDVNGRDKEGSTALHFAAWCENAGIYASLVREGGDEKAKDADGSTPRQIMSTSFAAEVDKAIEEESSK